MKLVRVVAPHFVAGFETDGAKVVRAAPILKYLTGKTEDYARHYLKQKGWAASIVPDRPPVEIIRRDDNGWDGKPLRCGSFEVRYADGRESVMFFWDDVASRRIRPEMLTSSAAQHQAETLAGVKYKLP